MFEYTCQECGQGTVRETTIRNYRTKIKGYPFVVPEAKIGICDRCKAEHFAAQETKRWEELFAQSLVRDKIFLLPEDIERVRKSLRLSMEDFALLIGCTRQSLYNWENHGRVRPQSRMADLLIKLVGKSQSEGKVDVIDFLVKEARKLGVAVEVSKQEELAGLTGSFVLRAKQVAEQLLRPVSMEKVGLAAEQESGRKVVIVETEDGTRFGRLRYDYGTATLSLQVEQEGLDLQSYDLELTMNDGKTVKCKPETVRDGQAVLLRDSAYTDRDIREIRLIPQSVRA